MTDEQAGALLGVVSELVTELTESAAVVTGVVIVAEWISEDGDRNLIRGRTPSLTEWSANGMWHEALYGHWPEDEEE